MPSTRKYRRTSRSSKTRKTRKPRRRRRRRYNLPVGMPERYKCKLRYTTVLELNAGTDASNSHTFRCNNIYDPDLTGTGHQPFGYDNLALQYEKYRVLGSKLTAKVVGFGVQNGVAQAIGIRKGAQSILQSPNDSIPELVEMGTIAGLKWKNVNIENPLKTAIAHTWSLRRDLGAAGTYEDTINGSTNGSGPATQNYFTLFVTSKGLSKDNPAHLDVMVTVDYVVEFFMPKQTQPAS